MSASRRGPLARIARRFLAAVLLVCAAGPAATARVESGRVVWVADGDTITVRIGSLKEKVRLIGIDTPELDDERPAWRRLAYEARSYARSLLQGRTVAMERDPMCGNRDRYGRLLRYVQLDDGTDAGEETIRRGYAEVYARFRFRNAARYKAAEHEAREMHRGRWSPAF